MPTEGLEFCAAFRTRFRSAGKRPGDHPRWMGYVLRRHRCSCRQGAHAPFAGPVTLTLPPLGCQCLSNPYRDNRSGIRCQCRTRRPALPRLRIWRRSWKVRTYTRNQRIWSSGTFRPEADPRVAFSATYLGNERPTLKWGTISILNLYSRHRRSRQLHDRRGTLGGVYVGGPYNGISDGLISGNASTGCSTAGNVNFRGMLYLSNPAQGQFYGAVTNFGDFGVASYNGLLVSAQHRFTKNFSVLSNLTWSHCLTEVRSG